MEERHADPAVAAWNSDPDNYSARPIFASLISKRAVAHLRCGQVWRSQFPIDSGIALLAESDPASGSIGRQAEQK